MYCTRRWRKFQDRKPIGEVDSRDAWMAEQSHRWIEEWLEAAHCSCTCNYSWSGSCSAVKCSVVVVVFIVVVVVVVVVVFAFVVFVVFIVL